MPGDRRIGLFWRQEKHRAVVGQPLQAFEGCGLGRGAPHIGGRDEVADRRQRHQRMGDRGAGRQPLRRWPPVAGECCRQRGEAKGRERCGQQSQGQTRFQLGVRVVDRDEHAERGGEHRDIGHRVHRAVASHAVDADQGQR
jgi:hypothetical protein